ncbi:hypothetical protein [Clostridium sp. Cult1]|jgi:phage tail sheath gpL-like|uniref:hypothetical protein n=1 Tax=Clostridium sp. Cult1 TaxID=2079002 RepID=UPI001F18FDC7|nr:hypothetical protein [Clostridium sp. Cult1]MCF6462202.1 hypothetical protein [Clostridium sp. Cult1]
MNFVRKIANSDVLADIIDIPKELRNKKVEIIILPYENTNSLDVLKKKSLRGALAKYKNEELQDKEKGAWANAVVEKHENS